MPTVKSKGQMKRTGQKRREDIDTSMPEAIPRDDLTDSFAGEENKGPASNEKIKHRGTHFKNRKSEHSRSKLAGR